MGLEERSRRLQSASRSCGSSRCSCVELCECGRVRVSIGACGADKECGFFETNSEGFHLELDTNYKHVRSYFFLT